MNQTRPCGCKSYRTCLICEEEYSLNKTKIDFSQGFRTFVYCDICEQAYEGWQIDFGMCHHSNKKNCIQYPGVYIKRNFLTELEEDFLVNRLDAMTWDLSQSGRRKQNFGPKCNFKKRKLKTGNFLGFPDFTGFVQEKFEHEDILKNFRTIEQCTLEYDPERGASIDPHIDDCWIWGERVVTVNLLADCVLTMTPNILYKDRYNLDCVSNYKSVITERPYLLADSSIDSDLVIRIPMPRRSLLVLYGSARYDWLHQVLRNDVTSRRLCLAYREFTPPYLEGGDFENEGKEVLKLAKCTLVV